MTRYDPTEFFSAEQKRPTNRARLHEMTDEELAKWLCQWYLPRPINDRCGWQIWADWLGATSGVSLKQGSECSDHELEEAGFEL